jgi:hypothetical protein
MASLRFGKLPPVHDYRTLRLKNYLLKEQLPPPPPTYDALDQLRQRLPGGAITTLFPMDGNDQYGDCTIAALAHAVTVFHGRLGQKNVMAAQDVIKLYLRLTKGADTGLVELDVLNYWRKHAAGGEKIMAYASIDSKNHTHVQHAIQLFGGVYLGFQVQEGCEQQFDERTPWIPGKLTASGHAVFATGYDADGVTVLTWGNLQKGTWDWWDECVDEVYALLPWEAMQTGFAPGFNGQQLKHDLSLIVD